MWTTHLKWVHERQLVLSPSNYPYSWNCYTSQIEEEHKNLISVTTSPRDCPQSCSVHTSCTTCLASNGLVSVAHARLKKLSTFRDASAERAKEFDPDDAPLPSSGQCFWLVVPRGNLLQPIRSITQIWVVTCHEISASAFVPETSSISRGRHEVLALFSGYDYERRTVWSLFKIIAFSKLIRQVAIVKRKAKHL